MMKSRRIYAPSSLAIALFVIATSTPALGEGKGQGAIVIRHDAPIYFSDTGGKIEAKAPLGYGVAGITVLLGSISSYMAEIENGRAHIIYLNSGGRKSGALTRRAWMNPDDLAFFTYECGCGEENDPCAPQVTAGWGSERWNPCFIEARDRKVAEIEAQRERGGGSKSTESAPATPPSPSRTAEKPLTNADVVALFTAGLDEDLILSKIQQAPLETLDVSTDSLIQLKKDGISKAILDAMIKKVGLRASARP